MLSKTDLQQAPYLKLERAEHHINDLNRRINLFLGQKPFKLTIHIRAEAGEVALRVKTEKAIPPEFAIIIGDAIHNMRSALDIVLYSMANAHTPKRDKIQFPFCFKPDGLVSAIQNGQVQFSGEKVVEAVRALKPYPDGNPILHGVHMLDIRDKHRLLILSRSIPQFVGGVHDIGLIATFMGLRRVPHGVPIRLAAPHDNDLITARLDGDNLIDMDGDAAVQPDFVISFGDEMPFANSPVIETLVKCQAKARAAIDAMIAAYLIQN